MGKYITMENYTITLTLDELKELITTIISLDKVDKALSKPQLTKLEAERLYGDQRVNKWIKAGLLKPVSQNGKGSKIYFSHKKINDLSMKSFHHLNFLDK